MRRLTIGILIAVLAGAADAQMKPWPAPALRIVDSSRVDPKLIEVYGPPLMALRPDGSIAVAGGGGKLFYFDSTARRRRWMRSLSPDVRYIQGLTWKGDSIYVIDNVTDNALAVGSNGGVGDMIEFPDFVRPKWKDRRSMPAYGAIDVGSVVDSSLVGAARRPHRMAVYGSSATADPGQVPVVRVDHTGIVQDQLATLVTKSDVWSVLSDGRLILFRASKDSFAFIGISPHGDTLFSRRLPKARAVFGSVGGPDGTIWVSYSLGGNEFYHAAFDARGNPIGRLSLPNNLRVGAGDARHLWVFEMRGSTRPITRYTVAPVTKKP
jgi:hypothetical protein